MNMKKISIGLLFLILALVVVPGASAYSGFLAAHPTSNPTPEVCGGCHPANGVSCTNCHTNPFTLTINANPTTVTAGTPSSVTFTVTRKNSAQAVSAATVGLTGVATGTGTTSSTGIAAISVTATSAGSITATASKTGYTNGIRTLTASAPAPVLTTITVSPPTATVYKGNTQAFTAAPKDQNGNPIAATITWTSSNSTVGTINSAGTFTALAAGTTTVRATSGSVSGTAAVTVTVPTPVLTTITVTPSTASVLVGGTQAFVAAPKDQNGNAIAATMTWTSSNTAIGTINSAGTFTALAAGTTTVRATSGSVSGTATVTVTTPVVVPVLTTITVSPSTASVLISATQAFVAAPKDQNGNPIAAAITWTSSNTTVGTVNTAGTFTALAAGTTTIRAENGSVNGSAAVTVPARISLPVLTTISVTPSNANVLVGKTQAFAATPKDQNGNPMGATITWASSNTAVGTIDTSGTFTALAAGTTTITAASKTLSGTVSGTATVTVTGTIIVPVLTTITVTPSTASVLVGGTKAFAAAPKDQNGNPIVAAITWTSSNTTVGTINAAGTFTALAAGTTTIRAANGSVNGTAAVTVSATSTGQKYVVTFKVTDGATGKKIEHAKVTMDRVTIETNDDGIAAFKNVAFGKHSYIVTKEKYLKAAGTITVQGNTIVPVKLKIIKSDDHHSAED